MIHRHLAELYKLQSLVFEASHWEPPLEVMMQRAIVTEMHIYCPSLQRVAFYLSQQASLWTLNDQDTWTHLGTRMNAQVEEHIWCYS